MLLGETKAMPPPRGARPAQIAPMCIQSAERGTETDLLFAALNARDRVWILSLFNTNHKSILSTAADSS